MTASRPTKLLGSKSSVMGHHLGHCNKVIALFLPPRYEVVHRCHGAGAVRAHVTVTTVVQEDDVAATHARHNLLFNLTGGLRIPIKT